MIYTHSITSKGQITLPKEFRDKLGLDKVREARISLNEKGEIVITRPKTLAEVRTLLAKPDCTDPLSEREETMGTALARKYGVR